MGRKIGRRRVELEPFRLLCLRQSKELRKLKKH